MAEINTSVNIENDYAAHEQEEENEIQFKSSLNRLKPIEETLIREEDLINELPDSIILHILSLLRSTREAIRTGVLSKRWQYLWTSVPILIFDYDDFEKITSSVDTILVLRGHARLKELVVTNLYSSELYQAQLSVLVRYAVICNVEKLMIDAINKDDDKFILPEYFFRNYVFTELNLDHCILEPIGEISWKNIKRLCIGHQCLNQNLVNSILSGSPSLEILELQYCHDEELDVLNITSTGLRKLVIRGYVWANSTDVLKIQAPNLLSLEILEDITILNIVLLDVHSLVEASLNYYNSEASLNYYYNFDAWEHDIDTANEMEEDMLKKIIQGLHQVNELKIGYACIEVLSRLKAKGFPYSPK